MILIDLAPIPNQSLTIVIGGNLYELRLQTRGGSLTMDVNKNNQPVVSGARVVAGAPIVQPFSKMVGENFTLLTNSNDLPDYLKFGSTQFLFYVTQADAVFSEQNYPVPLIIDEPPPP